MRHKSIGMFHAVIDHTPNSDAVGKRQHGGGGDGEEGGGDKEREGGWKEGRGGLQRRRKEERKVHVRGKQGCNTAYTHVHVHAQKEGK